MSRPVVDNNRSELPLHLTPEMSAEEQTKVFDEIVLSLRKLHGKNPEKFEQAQINLRKRLDEITLTENKAIFLEETKFAANLMLEAVDEKNRVFKHQEALVKAADEPGKVDLTRYLTEMHGKMGYGENRWDANHESYGPSKFKDKDILGGTAQPPFYNQPHFKASSFFGYAGQLNRLREASVAKLAGGEEYLNKLLDHGEVDYNFHALSPEEKRKKIATRGKSATTTTFNTIGRGSLKLADFLGKPVRGVFNWAGKGVWSKSDPNKDSRYQDFLRHRAQQMQNIAMMNFSSSKRAELLNKFKQLLESDSKDTQGLAAGYKELVEMVEKAIKEEKDERAKAKDTINQGINNVNEAAVDSAKDKTKAEDDMHKWRMLQAFLIITPFAGVSVLGPVVGVFGNIFAGGLPSGIVGLMGSLGPFSDVIEAVHLDDAVFWILNNCPIISDIIGGVDSIITSDLVNGVFGGVLAPVLLGPAAGVALAALVSLKRADVEIAHYNKYKDVFKGHEDAMKAEMEKFYKTAEDLKTLDPDKLKKFYEQFVAKQMEVSQEINYKIKLVEMAKEKYSATPEFFTKIMSDKFSNDLKAQKIIDGNGVLDEQMLMKSFSDKNSTIYKKYADEFFNSMTLFAAVEREDKDLPKDKAKPTLDDKIARYEKYCNVENGSDADEKINKEKATRRNEFILAIAEDHPEIKAVVERKNLDTPELKANAMLEKILAKEVRQLEKENGHSPTLKGHVAPSAIISRAKSAPLNKPLVQQTIAAH